MGQKTHPIGVRLGIIKTWDSKWYDKNNYTSFLHEDLIIRKLIKENLFHAGISKIEIERAGQSIRVIIHTARPGIIIGKKGSEVEKLKKEYGEDGFRALIPDIAASSEEAICEVLIAKTARAALANGISSIIVTGGVSANSRLRELFREAAFAYDFTVYFPQLSLTGDNAGMIGIAGYLKARYTGKYDDAFTLRANPDLRF